MKCYKDDYSKCQIKPLGLFPRFSACYEGIPASRYNYGNILQLISKRSYIRLEDLIFPLKKYFPKPSDYPRSNIFHLVFNKFKMEYDLRPVSCYYILMYIFSMFVRYKPVEWIEMLEGHNDKYPRIDWILEPLFELAITDYPDLILDDFRRHFSYRFRVQLNL